jgi:hypothetical protein
MSAVEVANSPPPEKRRKKISFMGYEEIHQNHPPTSYMETLANLLKGNMGTGKFWK